MAKKNIRTNCRIYPQETVAKQFDMCFDATRFYYNKLVESRNKSIKEHTPFENTTPKVMKDKYPFLKKVDSLALCNVEINFKRAVKNHKNNPKQWDEPKFHSKKTGKKSFTTNNQNGTIALLSNENGKFVDFRDSYKKPTYLKIPKCEPFRIVLSQPIPDGYELKSVTIIEKNSGKYYASILWEYEEESLDEDYYLSLDFYNKSIGLDYSSPNFYVDNQGVLGDMPRFFELSKPKITKIHAQLKHAHKGSKRRAILLKRLNKIYEHIENQRTDWIRKKTLEFVRNPNIQVVFVEDLDMQEQSKRKKTILSNGKEVTLKCGKNVGENCWGQFLRNMDNKLTHVGKKLYKIDRYDASTKTCSCCGETINICLDERVYKCSSCGLELDRDVNAARNILKMGISRIEGEIITRNNGNSSSTSVLKNKSKVSKKSKPVSELTLGTRGIARATTRST